MSCVNDPMICHIRFGRFHTNVNKGEEASYVNNGEVATWHDTVVREYPLLKN